MNYTLHGHKLRLFTLWEAQFPGTVRDLLSKSDRCATGGIIIFIVLNLAPPSSYHTQNEKYQRHTKQETQVVFSPIIMYFIHLQSRIEK
jgi:hypothetical protein